MHAYLSNYSKISSLLLPPGLEYLILCMTGPSGAVSYPNPESRFRAAGEGFHAPDPVEERFSNPQKFGE